MKKKIVLFGILFCLTGCSANVNINIDDNKVTENITATASNSSEYSEFKNWNGFPLPLYYDQELENPFAQKREKESGVEYYNVSFDDSKKSFTANAEFDFESHTRSSMIRNCFNYYNIIEEGNNITFSTSSGLICSFSNISINVITPYKVIDSNANTINENDNIYTWKINNSNSRNISIYFVIDKSKSYKTNEEDKKNYNDTNSTSERNNNNKNNQSIFIAIGVIIGVIVLITIFILKLKSKKASEI